jgi:PIN domain nuclease of toxin-antitoxin system
LKYIIDSYAWLEYFMGTDGGEKVKAILDSEVNEKLTPSICLAEIYAKILRSEDAEKAELRRAFIKSRSALVVLGEELAVEAAKLDVVMKKRVPGWGLADSIVLSTARDRGGKVVTGDQHFRGLPEVYMI